jgi:hypothetical protein
MRLIDKWVDAEELATAGVVVAPNSGLAESVSGAGMGGSLI